MKKELMVVGIILLFICMSINSSFAFDNVKKSSIPVSNGNTLYVGGSGEGNYTKIQDAIDNATDGDTVFVYDDSSPYFENIWINISISLIGEDKNTTIIQSNNGTYDTAIISIYTDGVFLSDFTFNNDFDGYGVLIKSNSNRIIRNIFKLRRTCIYLRDESSNNIISLNSFFNSSFGIILEQYCNNNIISNNTFDGNWVGLRIGAQSDEIDTRNNTIEYNIVTNSNISGITLHHAKDTMVSHNIINLTKRGFGLHVGESNYIAISDNRIEFNIDGVWIYDSSHITITRNTIYSNENGSYYLSYGAINSINNHNYEIISNNISKNTGYALYLFNGGWKDFKSRNKIYYNNFISNEKDVYLYNTYFNRWNGNYWNESRFLPKILFVEFKLLDRLRWINIDWHPAKEPYDISIGV
jgi:parallel beta-helix repeat protein